MSDVTVHDAIRLALPIGTTVLAGAQSLHRLISWPVVARAVAPLFTDLRGNEFALVSIRSLRDIDPPLSLSTLIERLVSVPIAALAVVGNVEEGAIALAEHNGLPLLNLADDVDIRNVDRELQRLVSDFEAQTDRRAAQIALEMGELALSGAGIPAMVDVLARRTGRCVSVYSAKSELVCADTVRNKNTIIPDYIPVEGLCVLHGFQFYCEVLRAGEQILGYGVIFGSSLTPSDKATIKRATMALALEFTKASALRAAEARFRGNFVEQVLSGQLIDPLTIQQRAREFSYDLKNPQRATLFCTDTLNVMQLQTVFAKVLMERSIHVPWIEHEAGILCFVAADEQHTAPNTVLAQLCDALRVQCPSVRIVQGRGSVKIEDWKHSVHDAEQVRMLPGTGNTTVTTFDTIGVYQLLLSMVQQEDAYVFYRRHLGQLLDYDREQNAELLQTLLTYFQCSGNLARTAETLHVHRNTLLYRLTRISQICGVDLEDPEIRLCLWISVKFHPLFSQTPS
jgi:purine catabolism regulator